jgi:Xaa-Pro aminopeptidase
MISMNSVLERGYTFWDRSLFPRDEFERRVHHVQEVMAEAGIDVLVITSDYFRTSGDLAFLSGWPMGGFLVLAREGEPTVLIPGGGREQYFIQMQTWVDDLRSTGDVGAIIGEVLDRYPHAGGRIGIVGHDQLAVFVQSDLARKFGADRLIDFTTEFQTLRTSKRPREITAIRSSLAIARKAVAAGQAAFFNGASNASAVVEAERIARVEGARCFRALANIGGTQLRPFESTNDERHSPLLLWVAVEQHGYWAEAVSEPAGQESLAAAAVDAMVRAVRSGATVGSVADAGLKLLPGLLHPTVRSYGLGAGIGLAIEECPQVVPGNMERLVEGTILSLRVILTDADPSIAASLVLVGADRGHILTAR